jgi:hypothetical protein
MNPEPKTPRDAMEEAAAELEKRATLDRISRESSPALPDEEPVSEAEASEERMPTYEMPEENQGPPEAVLSEEDKEKLGAK